MSVWAVLLAAGSGSRFGGDKQFARLGGVRMVDRVVRSASAACDRVVVVLPPGVVWDGPPVAATVAGGASRADSVRAGLGAVPADAAIVVVHDAAHPLAAPELFASVIAAVRAGADAAIPALPMNETVKRVRDGRVVETVPRDHMMVAQTPHAFRAEVLRAVHAGGGDAVEDTMMVEAAGGAVAVVPGDPRNLHVTTPDELRLAARLLR